MSIHESGGREKGMPAKDSWNEKAPQRHLTDDAGLLL
jgi:hypothetical protein